MSCDLLDTDNDTEGSAILLTMRASGFAQLTILEKEDGNIADFNLTPDEAGLKKAKDISDALIEWQNHIKITGLLQ